MKILIISDSFMPEGNAAAVHMTELANKLSQLGHTIYICTSANERIRETLVHPAEVFQFKNPWKRSNKYVRRALGEMISALILGFMLRFSRKSLAFEKIIVYSPTIFWALTLLLVRRKNLTVDLIVRDMFPLWLMHAGILQKRSFQYKILNIVAKLQFLLADNIYVQSKIDQNMLIDAYNLSESKIKELNTWMDKVAFEPDFQPRNFFNEEGKHILWLGNMGIAQNRDLVIDVICHALALDTSLHFNLVGIKEHDKRFFERKIYGMEKHFTDRINLIPSLSHVDCVQMAYRSDLGFLSLSDKTTSGNIPGKFVTYLMSGLPVFALCDDKTSISEVINANSLGAAFDGKSPNDCAIRLVEAIKKDFNASVIKNYFDLNHATQSAVEILLGGNKAE